MSMLSDADREWARTIAKGLAYQISGTDWHWNFVGAARDILDALAKRDAEWQPVELSAEDQEHISGIVHEQWMETKRSQGITSRKSESGEELMVPYGQLSEPVKELDRVAVRSVLIALDSLLGEKRK